ncbi:MAG TPA: glycosyltransferase [Thermoanaerobaculia bacterium]
MKLDLVFLGLSITSSWGNGHATTYRGLLRELAARGHRVRFFERDVPWYAPHRDLPSPPFAETILYSSMGELRETHATTIRNADAVILGSYVPDGIEVGEWIASMATGVTAFYDIDTPVTLASLERGECEYLAPSLIPRFDLYLSFTGGPTLHRLERDFGAKRARPLYCSFDPAEYFPEESELVWDLGYLGTYSADRQPFLDDLLVQPARRWAKGRFIVAGPQYPETIVWPANVERVEHLPPREHRRFYNRQRFTLNVTRADMRRAGWSPSVRLFEAAACATPIVSDFWAGLDELFLPNLEILVAHDDRDSLRALSETGEDERRAIGERARKRVLAEHTAAHRAEMLEQYVSDAAAPRFRAVSRRAIQEVSP